MKLRGKLTAQEVKDVGGVVRSKWYWPKLLLRSFYGVVLVCALCVGTVTKIVSRDWHNWQVLGGFWLVLAIIVTYAVYSTRSSTRKELVLLNARLPDVITVDDKGLHTLSESGKTSSQPWSTFSGWRDARSVFLLDMEEVKGFVMLPLSNLEHIEREQLRQLLSMYLTKGKNTKATE